MDKEHFFILNSASDPWGDYGDILIHGMAMHSGSDSDAVLQLERCAPFVPPMSLPGTEAIVVTDAFRRDLEASGLRGFNFRPLVKARIVRNDWHDGSRRTDEPPEFPEEGEPENYILDHPHDESLARAIGEMWELVPKRICYTTRKSRIVENRKDITLVIDGWDGADIFRADGVLFNYTTGKARDWLLNRVPELVSFEEAVVAHI